MRADIEFVRKALRLAGGRLRYIGATAGPQVGSSDRIVLSALASNFSDLMAETLFENGNGQRSAEAGDARLLRELSDGDQVTGAFVVRERERRQKRNGEDFLRVVLADKTGHRSRRSPGTASPSASRSAPRARS